MNASPSPEERLAALEAQVQGLQTRLNSLEKNILNIEKLFQPAYGFVAALAVAVALTLASFAVFKEDQLKHYLSYVVPISIPFVVFLFERFRLYHQRLLHFWPALLLDGLVTGLSLVRAVYELPFISGHALFLTFALLTVKSAWARIPTLLVLIQVIYLKAFVWHDNTLIGGVAAGLLAAALWHITMLRHKPNMVPR